MAAPFSLGIWGTILARAEVIVVIASSHRDLLTARELLSQVARFFKAYMRLPAVSGGRSSQAACHWARQS
jgi:hypothetical protein